VANDIGKWQSPQPEISKSSLPVSSSATVVAKPATVKPEISFVAPIEYSRLPTVSGEISAGPRMAIFRQIYQIFRSRLFFIF